MAQTNHGEQKARGMNISQSINTNILSYYWFILIIGILSTSFLYMDRLGIDFLFILIFVGGLSNLAAINDISYNVYCNPNNGFGVKFALLVQLLVLSFLLGIDCWLVFKNQNLAIFKLGISLLLVIVIFVVSIIIPDDRLKGILAFIIFILIALWVYPDLFPKIKDWCLKLIFGFFDKTNLPLTYIQIQKRIYAYIHLLFIPFLYLFIDFLNVKVFGSRMKGAEKSIPLDLGLALTGLACFFSGIVANDPIFEHGAAAAILIFGNFSYTLFIHGK